MNDLTKPKERWGTRVGVILAVTGSAVGLGNFLRFPGLAAQYEGGAFMIPYFVALLVLGIPMAWAEWSIGRYGGRKGYHSTPGVYYAIWKKPSAAYLGVLGLIVPVMIYMFYVFIEAWCLGFAWKYLIGDPVLLGTATEQVTVAGEAVTIDSSNAVLPFVGLLEGDGSVFSNPFQSALIFLLLCFVLNFFLIYRGINKGIERFCNIAMPALVACAVIVLVRVLTLPPNPDNPEQNVMTGLGYMWNPGHGDKSMFEALANADIWLAAAGQIFFSLSIGFGIVITYASYLRKKDDIALSSLTAASGNSWCEVSLGGLILIPATFVFLGALSKDTLDSGFQLGFMVLPQVFEAMPAGRWFGFLFFFLLFLSAVTSSLSMLQPAIAFLEEGLGLTRKMSVTLLGLITLLGAGFVVYFTNNLAALDALDFWVATLCIYILATIQVLMFGWVLGLKKGFEELDRGAEMRVPRFVGFILKYVSPIYLLIIFGFWVTQKLPDRISNMKMVEGITLGFVAVILITFLLLIGQALRRWNLPSDAPNCENCGYNLTGVTSDKCPECGHPIPPDTMSVIRAESQTMKGLS